MTTEEKLKELKKINDKIERVDNSLEEISKWADDCNSFDSILFEADGRGDTIRKAALFYLTPEICEEIFKQMQQKIAAHKSMLIERANQLIR